MLLAHAPTLYRNPSQSAPVVSLAYDEYTVLMLHCDPLGAGGTTAYDSSRSRHGYAAQAAGCYIQAGGVLGGTGALYVGGVPSGYGYISAAKQNGDFDFGYGDFTIDWWEYRFDTADARPTFVRNIGAQTYQPWMIGYSASGYQQIYASNDNASWNVLNGMSLGPITINAWHHLVFCRRGDKFMTFRNGVKQAEVISGAPIANSNGSFSIGLWQTSEVNQYFNYAYLDEIRISKGICRWTENFTPPISQYGPKPDTQVMVLMHCDGNYEDSSQINHRPNHNGYMQPTAAPKFGQSALAFTTPTAGAVAFPGSANDWNLGTEDFTIDIQVVRDAASDSTKYKYLAGVGQSDSIYSWLLICDPTTNFIRFIMAGDAAQNQVVSITGATALTPSVYHHVAVTRQAGTVRLFLDGVQQGSSATYAGAPYFTTSMYMGCGIRGGYVDVNNYCWLGAIDEFRVVRGRAEWVANFTPPTAAHAPAGPEQSVLLLHAGGVHAGYDTVDSSPYNRTRNGVSAGFMNSYNQQKFGRSSFVVSGSAALIYPISNDWDFGQSDWTIDWWEYPFNTTSPHCVAARDAYTTYASWLIYSGGGNRTFYASADNANWMFDALPMGAMVANAWTHFAITKQGPAYKFFKNGALTNTANSGAALPNSGYGISIGYAQSGNLQFAGHLDEFRITKGKALWTAAFTAPTAPYAPDPDWNTLLLLHFDGANNAVNTIDSSPYKRNMAMRGNAKLSTAWSKFGTSSMLCDGSSTSMTYAVGSAQNSSITFGAYDFTIDFWMKSSVSSPICGKGYFSSGADFQITLQISGDAGQLRVQGGAGPQSVGLDFYSTSNTYFNGVEHHVALVRNGNVFTLYKDGVADGSQTIAITLMNNTGSHFIVGQTSTSAQIYNGHLDEFRISNVARWTAPFTPPTAPYTV